MLNETDIQCHNEEEGSICSISFFLINYILLPVLSALGIIANLVSSLVFYQILKYSNVDGYMLKYLFVKSVDDLLQFIFHIFSVLYYCHKCELSRTYAGIVWYIGFFLYAESCVEFSSAWMEVLATFDCFCIITKQFSFVKSRAYSNTMILFVHVYSILFYLFWLFSFRIVPTSYTFYEFQVTSFGRSTLVQYLKYFHTFSRDIVVFILLILFNVLIFLTFRKRKRAQANQAFISNTQRMRNKLQAQKIEKSNKIIISLIGVNFLVGRIGPVLYHTSFFPSDGFWNCYKDVFLAFFYMSYLVNIFIYYLFNRSFRKILKQNLKALLYSNKNLGVHSLKIKPWSF